MKSLLPPSEKRKFVTYIGKVIHLILIKITLVSVKLHIHKVVKTKKK